MKRSMALGFFFTFLIASLYFFGCKSENRNITEPVPPPLQSLNPTGQIVGQVYNAAINSPVANAVVTISYSGATQRVITDAAGNYSFSGVPVGQYQTIDGKTVSTGTYAITASLVEYNKNQPDSLKYRDYYFDNKTVTFTSISNDTFVVGVQNLITRSDIKVSYLNTTVRGTVVDQNNSVVSGAVVYLFDSTPMFDSTRKPAVVIKQAVTDANGLFSIKGVDNGLNISIKAVSSDGGMESTLKGYQITPNITNVVLHPEVPAERLELKPVDNHPPFVVSISPEYGSDIVSSSNQNFVYTFSEPIKQTPYTRYDAPYGSGGILDDIVFTYDGTKKISGPIRANLKWNPSFTQLTISPNPKDSLTSGKYTLNLNKVLPKLTDNTNWAVVDNANLKGDVSEALQFTVYENSTKVLDIPNVTATGTLDFSGGTIKLSWLDYTDNASGFNVYSSIDGQPYQLIANQIKTLSYSTTVGSLVYPSGALEPIRSVKAKFKVKPVSKDLFEGTESAEIVFNDNVLPKADTHITVAASPSGDSTNYTYSDSVYFSEPMNAVEAAKAANYAFVQETKMAGKFALTVSAITAEYAGYNASSKNYMVIFGFTTSRRFLTTDSIRVNCSGVKDLFGNGIDPKVNFFRLTGPFAPIKPVAVPVVSAGVPQDTVDCPGNSNITITWQPVTTDQYAKGYKVYRSTDGGVSFVNVNRILDLQTTTYTGTTGPLYSKDTAIALTATYYVCAISSDIVDGAFSNGISFSDKRSPKTSFDTSSAIKALAVQGDTTTYTATLSFSEPMNLSYIISIGNYTATSQPTGLSVTLSKIEKIGYSSAYTAKVTFTTKRKFLGTDSFIITCYNLRDLAGNLLPTTGGKNIFKVVGL